MSQNAQKPVMLIAVVQALDSNIISAELEENGISFSKLPSIGGFLREKNVTFIIACGHQTEQWVRSLLMEAAKKRVTFIATPLESGPIPVPVPVESVVGGVKALSIELDDFQEF
ncbi:MAG: cyclic-di-AMP receptor [Anaerolineaceae bacterium]|nr:cyclic-di-AMP receptor [Anaerolineaceae bacterium]